MFCRGTDYEKHVKCITENEKYGGKNYVPKPGANKGEQKQEAWCQVFTLFPPNKLRLRQMVWQLQFPNRR